MNPMLDDWPQYGQGEIPFTEPPEQLQSVPWLVTGGNRPSHPHKSSDDMAHRSLSHGALAFTAIPIVLLVSTTFLWGGPHHLWVRAAWLGAQRFEPFDYIAPGAVGRAFELVYWVNFAVQLRWLSHTIAANRRKGFTFRNFFMMWLFDTLNTPFVSWILLVLLQGLTITFSNGLKFSLADADIVLFSALSALLGMSVRETRALVSRLAHALFKRLSHDRPD